MQEHSVPLDKTGYFSKLMLDYISGNLENKGWYNRIASLSSFKKQIEEKSKHVINREVLVNCLQQQYADYNLLESNLVTQNIQLLNEENTFTIVTGHQLCLFTGPLYFIYKIVNAINLCKQLQREYPKHHFIPVFWMASEDHDFPEVNHFNFMGHKMAWQRDMGGPVGRMSLDGIESIFEELQCRLPSGERATTIINRFEEAYLKHGNLAEATRYLVHSLFGEYGLVILDADNHDLKSLVAPYFKRELLEGITEREMTATNTHFKNDGYKVQVNPRDVNLFYMLNDYRERLTLDKDGFKTADGLHHFTRSEILEELEKYPERFSPNVALRPLYQEVVLPNLAYIGGGGELAYWLQLKGVFEAFNVPFPILRLRNSVALISKRIQRKIDKLKIDFEDVFLSQHELSKKVIQRECELEKELKPIRQQFNTLLDQMNKLVIDFDPTMERSIEAQRAHIKKGILQLEKKMIRSAKRKDTDYMRMIEEVKTSLFPGGGLQERHDNIAEMWLEYGDELISTLTEKLKPLDNQFGLIVDKV